MVCSFISHFKKSFEKLRLKTKAKAAQFWHANRLTGRESDSLNEASDLVLCGVFTLAS